MISHIAGTLLTRDLDRVELMTSGGVGYELQIPLSNTNYHVTELAKSGLIELVRERQVRGATEHFYRLPGTGEAAEHEEQEAEESERAWAMA